MSHASVIEALPGRTLPVVASRSPGSTLADGLIGVFAYLPNKACGFTLYASLNRKTTRAM